MFLSQGFRVLNSWSRRHVSKIRSAKTAPVRSGTFSSVTDLPDKHSQPAKSVTSKWYGRLFSSDSQNSSSLEDERRKLRNDPEIRVWMNQIAQDFETQTAPFQDLVDQEHSGSQHPRGRSSDESVVSSMQETPDIEIEEFGYIEDDENDFVDHAPQERNVPVSLKRGRQGVFDVEEVVAVLDDENGVDIQVIDIPPEARFVAHMVVVSGKSLRHMRAMAAAVEWLHKRKKEKRDRHCKLEGRDCNDWIAMDLGNIVLHIFTPEARQHYDLETLWTLGPEHDDPRHYVHDDSLNLSAADLFWLESGGGGEASSPQSAEDSDTLKNGGGCDGDSNLSTDLSLTETVKNGGGCDGASETNFAIDQSSKAGSDRRDK